MISVLTLEIFLLYSIPSIFIQLKFNEKRLTKIEIFKSLALDYKKNNDTQKSKIEAEKIFELDKTNLWANVFLLSLAEEIEDWDYAEKKARDLKKIKGFDGEINLSKYKSGF